VSCSKIGHSIVSYISLRKLGKMVLDILFLRHKLLEYSKKPEVGRLIRVGGSFKN